ncbi:MAG: PhzF family phenazine biosynthesis protein [Pontiellaceae bacterium]|nr:PhzF family phenazine biosynthesis protein [Pontiellaceae bacterium]
MTLDFYQVDAFTDDLFSGNPAAVYPLKEWLADTYLQAIAAEHNLSETAFFVPEGGGYHLRWFTPAAEVALCGHATLASAHIIFSTLEPQQDNIRFSSLSGSLWVRRENDRLTLNFPAQVLPMSEAAQDVVNKLGVHPVEILQGDDYLVVLESEDEVVALNPNSHQISQIECRGICVTAPGNSVDFVSRFFAPRLGIDEDPVTGSAHCYLTPYWSDRLGKTELTARQLSKRGGTLWVKIDGDRVYISGNAVTYSKGQAFL